MIVKNITGLGASIGIAIGNSYKYENSSSLCHSIEILLSAPNWDWTVLSIDHIQFDFAPWPLQYNYHTS